MTDPQPTRWQSRFLIGNDAYVSLSEAEARIKVLETLYESAVDECMARLAERDEARARAELAEDALADRIDAEARIEQLEGALERIRDGMLEALSDHGTYADLKERIADLADDDIARALLASTPQPESCPACGADQGGGVLTSRSIPGTNIPAHCDHPFHATPQPSGGPKWSDEPPPNPRIGNSDFNEVELKPQPSEGEEGA